MDRTSGSISYRLPANDDARVSMRSARGTVRSTASLTASREWQSQHPGTTWQWQRAGDSQQPNWKCDAYTRTEPVRRCESLDERPSRYRRGSAGRVSANSETGSQIAINQRAGGSSIGEHRDPIQPNPTDVMDPEGTKQGVQSNGSVSRGSDQSNDSKYDPHQWSIQPAANRTKYQRREFRIEGPNNSVGSVGTTVAGCRWVGLRSTRRRSRPAYNQSAFHE